MKNALGKFLMIVLSTAALLLPAAATAQKRIYTRSFKMQDFRSKTTKVVLGGSDVFNAALRQEVTSLWTVSPYEFCSPAEYEKQKNNPETYFLYTESSRGIVYLTLGRGGNDAANDAFKRPLTVVSIPVAGEADATGNTLQYLPAFISIIQDYADRAIDSEFAAYRGLGAISKRIPADVTLITDPEEASAAFTGCQPATAVRITITPSGRPEDKPRYRITFRTDTYEFYSLRK